MDNYTKIDIEIQEFIRTKHVFDAEFMTTIMLKDKDRLLEILIENGLEDSRFCSKIRYLSKKDPFHDINEGVVEGLKEHLFKIMK